MKVLKFGGTSVGSAQNIKKVIAILQKESLTSPIVCVVSAVGGVTDKLLQAGALAKQKDKSYLTVLDKIKSIHYKVIEGLTSESKAIITEVDQKFEALNQLLNGIFLINELSPKTSDKLVSYGDILSSFIIAKTMEGM